MIFKIQNFRQLYFFCLCNSCIEGYYGDPRLSVGIACRPCPCPGDTQSGHSFATRCSLNPSTKDVQCECQEGYLGKLVKWHYLQLLFLLSLFDFYTKYNVDLRTCILRCLCCALHMLAGNFMGN